MPSATLTILERPSSVLDAECHDGVDYVVIVLLEGLDGLRAGHGGLGHDELNVLVLEALGVNLLIVILFLLLGVAAALDGLGVLAVAVVVTGVVVLATTLGQLLGSGLLGGRVQVLNLGLTEDAVT